MFVQEAVKSQRPVRRKAWTPGTWWNFNPHGGVKEEKSLTTYQLTGKDILADDWEIKPEDVRVSKETAVNALLASHFHTRSAVPTYVMEKYLADLGFT